MQYREEAEDSENIYEDKESIFIKKRNLQDSIKNYYLYNFNFSLNIEGLYEIKDYNVSYS